ncbi:MAG: recombinase family protein [Proteobacteria bacterium]|nr:recombinase family protein [Pseudomonadota bacterium]
MASKNDQQDRDNVRDIPPKPIRAAQYVRMSTEHQRYSTENQSEAIALYAERRGFEIVETYADEGKSGLNLEGRSALKRLISDVNAGTNTFAAILVYDISRWGRFQDADESAYYEFICKEAGISVHYCAEQFENDGSLSATIIKNMKRAMAGEYSRELSAKVFAGQCRLVSLGFRQGGPPGFGLRRQLIDQLGQPKAALGHGEQKSLQTDRVILVPGPEEERDLVRRIYDLFVNCQLSEKGIAEQLNKEGLVAELGLPWSKGRIHQILTNEKYIGNNVYNRHSYKLKMKHVANPPDMWIRAPGAFKPLISPEMFDSARRIILARAKRFSDAELLTLLAQLQEKYGFVSGIVIDEQENMPSSTTYRSRFGSLVRAYSLIGYTPDRDYRYIEINRLLRSHYQHHLNTIIDGIRAAGGTAQVDCRTGLVEIGGEISAAIIFCRCLQTASGRLRWKLRLDNQLKPDVTLAVRMEADNQSIRDFYLLPWIDIAALQLNLKEENGLYLDAYHIDDLSAFYRLTDRTPIEEAAA